MIIIKLHKEKTPSHTNLNTLKEGGAQYDDVPSGYKVKEIIHNSQENDRKLLGLDERFTTKYKKRDPEDNITRTNSHDTIRKHSAKIANRLNVGNEMKVQF